MQLSRDNHPDRPGGNQERFEWLARSYEVQEELDGGADALY